tara:strand:+ start:1128 stop:2795 length:1668 start_codon:yes stop_codon:yes gene_type:complete
MKIIGLYGALNWKNEEDNYYDMGSGGTKTYLHDSNCSYFENGKHIRSISEERLSRVKYDGNFPLKSIEYCLGEVTKEEVDIVSYVPCKGGMFLDDECKKFLKSIFPNAQIWFVRHHLAHAASSVFTSPFTDGSFFVLDGAGSTLWDFAALGEKFLENTTTGYFDKSKNIFTFYDFPSQPGVNCFGDYYSTFSRFIYTQKTGVDLHGTEKPEGKVMGLSAYGSFDSTLEPPYTKSTEAAKNAFNIDRYEFGYPVVNFFDYSAVAEYLDYRMKLSPEDMSCYVQRHFEDALHWFLQELKNGGHLSENVCFAGGCFLNILANSKIKNIFSNVHIPPYTDDSGLALGAALWAAYKTKETINMPENLALLGKSYEDYIVEEENSKYYENFDELCEVVAKELEQDKIVGWFQGKSEHGPRALGSRSLLMNPKNKSNKDIMNSRVKHREHWRPFAGIMLEEYVGDYFEPGEKTPYMLYSQTSITDKIPSIDHGDRTCRIQTVNDKLNPRICKLLRKLEVPILLNTSFNDNGEPIIETPEDAISSFKKMDIDYLVIGNYLLWN